MLRSIEAKHGKVRLELDGTIARLNVTIIDEDKSRTVLPSTAKETVNIFSEADVQLHNSFLTRFGRCIESVFGRLHQKCLLTTSHSALSFDVQASWPGTGFHGAGPSNAGRKFQILVVLSVTVPLFELLSCSTFVLLGFFSC